MDQAFPLLPIKIKSLFYKKTVSAKDNLNCCILAGEGGKPGNEAMPSMRVAPEIQSWGEGPTSRESPYRDSCTFEALAKQNKQKKKHP